MVVSEENHRRYITFPKELEKRLEELAKEDHRNFSNLVVHILQKYVDEIENDKKKELD